MSISSPLGHMGEGAVAQFDAAGSVKLGLGATFFAELLNLSNQPLQYTLGETARRLNQSEWYSFSGLVGIRIGQ